jgi:hypothetical protein
VKFLGRNVHCSCQLVKKGRGADANESHPVIISIDILRNMIECDQRTKGWAGELYKRESKGMNM